MERQTLSTDSKIIAIVSYLGLLGWILAYIIYQKSKSEFAIFHLRQALGINIIGFFIFFILRAPFFGWALALAFFVLWLMGFIYAIKGEEKPVPLIGDFIQDLFKGIR